MKIAITGSIGSGKSSVGQYLKSKGYAVVDTDTLVHDMYKDSLYDSVLEVFSLNVLDDSGAIDRKKLAQMVFNDPLSLNDLESIVFPAVGEYILNYDDKSKIAFFEVPMLFESGLETLFDSVLMIASDQELSLDRLVDRGISREDALKRLGNQMDPEEKISRSQKVIYNNEDKDSLYEKVDDYLKEVEDKA